MTSPQSLTWATLLTAAHFSLKLAGGILTNSLALISDAWHLLTDLLSLLLSWWALKKSSQPPTEWATYGFHRVGILAALINNITLVGISLYILYESYLRFLSPQSLDPRGMFGLALVGVGASAAIVYLVNEGSKKSLNLRSVWLHFAGEALASAGVLIGAVIIHYTNWYWVDTILSALLGLAILRGAVAMLWDIVVILLEGMPSHISLDQVTKTLVEVPCVAAARDIHVWCLAEEKVALSAHVQIDHDITLSQTEPILSDIKQTLAEKYNISHINIQFEINECTDCHHNI